MSSTNSPGQSLFRKKNSFQSATNDFQIQTPQSPNYTIKIDVKNLQRTQGGLIRQFKAFVMGISGGDCAGKKELINFMFDKIQTKLQDGTENWTWKMIQTGQSVAVLHQSYFMKNPEQAHISEGVDWETFKKKAISLSIGNSIKLSLLDAQKKQRKIRIAPAKVVCIQGSHIFCYKSLVNDIMNLRVFIDSDSDVRLSRRIYKDTVQNNMLLDLSIENYLRNIKKSYEKQIEPTKVNCDVVIPHFGNGYADHTNKSRDKIDLNIRNAVSLLLSHARNAMKFYQDEENKEK